jgi:hypothetical protein
MVNLPRKKYLNKDDANLILGVYALGGHGAIFDYIIHQEDIEILEQLKELLEQEINLRKK